MKLNITCVRDILLYIEDLSFQSVATIDQLHEAYPQYSKEDIEYNCLKLIEGGYLDGVTISMLRSCLPSVKYIVCMTFEGHQFLDTIRPEKVFEKTKNVLASVGTGSFDVITKIGTTLLAQMASSALGM